MSFVDDFKEMFTVTVLHSPLTGRDRYGAPTFGASVSYKARVVRENKLVTNEAGEEVVSSCHVWLQGAPVVDVQDRIELEDSNFPKIITVERFQDEKGPSHTKVYF